VGADVAETFGHDRVQARASAKLQGCTIYAQARARGHDHPHAIRILARAWIRVIYRCWLDHQPYDLAKHGNAARSKQPRAA
jgi:hypothetical protein